MAQRRMFSRRIVESGRFLRMPPSSQMLYFHLGIEADDDGVVEAFNVIRACGASEDDLRVLSAKGFVVVLNDDLVTYILDWRENNRIRPDRKINSIYQNLLLEKLPHADLIAPKPRADTGKKTGESRGRPLDDQWTENGPHRLVKVRLGEVRLGKSITNNNNDYIEIDFKGLTPTSGQLDLFGSLIGGLPVDLVQYAVDKTMAIADNPSINYAATIIKHWLRAGITTLAQAQDEERQRTGAVLDEVDPATGEHVKIPIFKLADQEGSGNNGLS